MNWIINYFFISGILTFLWFFYIINYSEVKEEVADDIADMTWNTGIKREHVKWLMYALALILGWFIIPYEIITSFIEGR